MFSNQFGPHRNVECGLITIVKINEYEEASHPVPLMKVDVEASVVHAVAQVQVTQVFKNKEEHPIEAIYYFPVDSNGAVTHFEAEVEGRKIKGTVKPHEEAEEQYKKAVENKQTAFLGSENNADIFKVNVGYLKPGSEAKIVIGYTAEVKNEKGSDTMRFFVPTTVAPRYVPPNSTDQKSQDLKNMKFSVNSPAPMSIKVFASIQGEIESLTSPTHTVVVKSKEAVAGKTTWTKGVVELVGSTTDMDRDFVLLIKPVDKQKPRLYVEKLEDSVAVMAHFIPSFKLTEQPVELIFVLDRSGSMQGQSIALAKKALLLFLHSLPMDCYFNVVGFGSTYKFLFPKSVKYDDGTLKAAVQHAKELEADMGGTEILEPLKQVYTLEPVRGYLRQIFILTDGEVSNTDEVLGLTKAKAHETRVFSLGIGDGASHSLVEGLATAGNGTSAFVTYNEGIEKKVLEQLKDAMQPSLTDVKIEWIGLETPANVPVSTPKINTDKSLMGYGKPVEVDVTKTEKKENLGTSDKLYYQSPDSIPPIFDGSQLVVFGIFRKPLNVPSGIKIVGESPDGPLTLNVELGPENELGSTGMIHKLASIKLIREMEMKVAALGLSSYRHEGHSEADKEMEQAYKKQIISIAVREGITSKYTSFVAIDTANDSQSSDNWVMQTRFVPSQFAHGWHGGFGGGGSIAYCASSAPMVGIMAPRAMSMRAMKSSNFSGNNTTLGLFGSGFGGSNAVALFANPSFNVATPTLESRMRAQPISGFGGGANSGFRFGISNTSGFAPTNFSLGLKADSVGDTASYARGRPSPQSCNLVQHSMDESVDDLMETDTTNAVVPEADELETILSFQSFDGSFKVEDGLLEILKLERKNVENDAKQKQWNLAAWVTTLVLAHLSAKLDDRKDSWELVAMKARKWIQKNHPSAADAMFQAATSAVGATSG